MPKHAVMAKKGGKFMVNMLLAVSLLLFLTRRDVMPYFHPHDQNSYLLFLIVLFAATGAAIGFEHLIIICLMLLAVHAILREYPWYTQPNASIFGHLDASYMLAPLGVFLLRLSPLQVGGVALGLCACALFRILPPWFRRGLVSLLEPLLVKVAVSASLAFFLLYRYYIVDTDNDGDKDWHDVRKMADTNKDQMLGVYEVCLFLLPVLVFASIWFLLSSFVGSELHQERQVPYRRNPIAEPAAGGGRGGGLQGTPSLWEWFWRELQELRRKDVINEATRLGELNALYARQEEERINRLRIAEEEAAKARSWTWWGVVKKTWEDMEWARQQNQYIVRQRSADNNRRRMAAWEAQEAAEAEARHREAMRLQALLEERERLAAEPVRVAQRLAEREAERRRQAAVQAAVQARVEAEAAAELRRKAERDRAEAERRRQQDLANQKAAREAQDERCRRAAREAAEAEARRQQELKAARDRAELENQRQRELAAAREREAAIAAQAARAKRQHEEQQRLYEQRQYEERQREERQRAEEQRAREIAAASAQQQYEQRQREERQRAEEQRAREIAASSAQQQYEQRQREERQRAEEQRAREIAASSAQQQYEQRQYEERQREERQRAEELTGAGNTAEFERRQKAERDAAEERRKRSWF